MILNNKQVLVKDVENIPVTPRTTEVAASPIIDVKLVTEENLMSVPNQEKDNLEPAASDWKTLLVCELKKQPDLTIEEQLEVMLETLVMREEEKVQRKELTVKLESWLSQSFPGCKCLPFGSSETGLATLHSDLDLSLCISTIDEVSHWAKWREQCIDILNHVSLVVNSKGEVKTMDVVRSARIPVFKFVHNPTDLHCDITCQKLGVHNSKLFRSLIGVDEVLFRPFFFLLKLWASSHGLIDSPNNGLSSYGLNLLALFYLQQLQLLPSVEDLQKKVPVKLCRYWNVSFSDPKPLDPATNRPIFKHLLHGFFQYYQSLDAAHNVISPFKGKLIPISDFSASDKSGGFRWSVLVNLMPRYTINLKKHKLPPLKISQLNIQEPFELNQNVSGGFLYIERFQSLCREAELICRQMTPTSPISSLFGNFDKTLTPSSTTSGATKNETINKAPINTGMGGAPSSIYSSVSITFHLKPTDPSIITRALTDQAIDAVGVFLGRLVSFSYGIAISEASSVSEDSPPKAKKSRSNPEEQQTAEHMVIRWNRPYDLSFLFDVFHPLRETVAIEVRNHQVETEIAKSLLDRERQITAILATRQLDGCAPAFYSPGGVRITCSLDCSRKKCLVILKLKNNQKTLQPGAFQQLVEGLGRYVLPIIELFLAQNLFPFKVNHTQDWYND